MTTSNRRASLEAGLSRARRAGKLLLVIVHAAVDDVDRGLVLASLLVNGSPAQLALWSLCEVVCAPMNVLQMLDPSIGPGDPWMVLIETDGERTTTQRIDLTLSTIGWYGTLVHTPPPQKLLQSFDLLTSQLRDVLVPDSQTVARRARQAESSLSPGMRADVLSRVRTDAISLAEIDRVAALAYQLAGNAADDPSTIERLGRSAQERLLSHPIPGSRWGQMTVSGLRIREHVERDSRPETERTHGPWFLRFTGSHALPPTIRVNDWW